MSSYPIMDARPQDEHGDELSRIVWRAAKHGCRDFTMFYYESPLKLVSVLELRAANYPEPLATANVEPFAVKPTFHWEYSTVMCWL